MSDDLDLQPPISQPETRPPERQPLRQPQHSAPEPSSSRTPIIAAVFVLLLAIGIIAYDETRSKPTQATPAAQPTVAPETGTGDVATTQADEIRPMEAPPLAPTDSLTETQSPTDEADLQVRAAIRAAKADADRKSVAKATRDAERETARSNKTTSSGAQVKVGADNTAFLQQRGDLQRQYDALDAQCTGLESGIATKQDWLRRAPSIRGGHNIHVEEENAKTAIVRLTQDLKDKRQQQNNKQINVLNRQMK
jgi:hypothetical protein